MRYPTRPNQPNPLRAIPAARSLAAVAVFGCLLALSAATMAQDSLAITNVTVIDGTGAPPLANATVLIKDQTIAAVGPAVSTPISADVERVDGGGRWLLPGFIDTHAHLSVGPVSLTMVDGTPTVSMQTLDDGPQRALISLLAHGVTTIRDPGGSTEQLVAIRNALANGELVGPRAVVAGRVIDGTKLEGLVDQASTAEQVRHAVRQQVAAGVDLIKLYTTLTPELLAAGIDEAHKHGRQAVAHLHASTWAEAAELGLDGIVHIVPGTDQLLPESVRESYAAKPGALGFPHWFRWVDLDGPEVAKTVRALALNNVHLDPTLVVFEHAFFGDLPRYTSDTADLELAHPALVDNWTKLFTFNIGWRDEDFDAAQRAWPKVLSFTRKLWEGGVMLSAGTDANNPWTVPGPSFHRELQLLAAAGIPNAQVLRIATRNGAEVAGLLDEVGTIQVGKRADLVLLNDNPLINISATQNIEWVMKDDTRYQPTLLLESIR